MTYFNPRARRGATRSRITLMQTIFQSTRPRGVQHPGSSGRYSCGHHVRTPRLSARRFRGSIRPDGTERTCFFQKIVHGKIDHLDLERLSGRHAPLTYYYFFRHFFNHPIPQSYKYDVAYSLCGLFSTRLALNAPLLPLAIPTIVLVFPFFTRSSMSDDVMTPFSL